MNTPRIPPHNKEAEQVILGTCLIGYNPIEVAVEMISPEMFYIAGHKVIFKAILDLYQSGINIDAISVNDILTKNKESDLAGGLVYLSELTTFIPSKLDNYCAIVLEHYIKREIISGFSGIVENAYSGSSSFDLINNIHSVAIGLENTATDKPMALRDVMVDSIAGIKECYGNKSSITGIRTGLTDLDRHMGGLQRSNYIVVAGRPSMGKTSLALKFLLSGAEDNESVMIFSMEMKNTRLANRFLSMKTGINGRRISSGSLIDNDWPKIIKTSEELKKLDIVIDHSTGLSIAELTAKAKKVAMKKNLGMIVVDYIQLMKGTKGAENRTRELAGISAGLLALAKELDVALVVLSQLNRGLENRTDKRPIMSDLRESGAIEQDADVICFIYRDEVYNQAEDNPNKGIAELIIAKGRDIGTRTVRVGFRGETTEFFNLAYDN